VAISGRAVQDERRPGSELEGVGEKDARRPNNARNWIAEAAHTKRARTRDEQKRQRACAATAVVLRQKAPAVVLLATKEKE
jgi:hypothetical protein